MSVSCVTIKFVACAPSTDKLLPWVYLKVDCRLAFVDSGVPGRGCAYSSPDEQDGHHPRLRGHGGRLHVHRQLQQLHRHDHGGGVDPICANHFFIDVGGGFNHAGYDSNYSSNVSDHADNASPASLLQREADRRHRSARANDQVVWPTCSDHRSQ